MMAKHTTGCSMSMIERLQCDTDFKALIDDCPDWELYEADEINSTMYKKFWGHPSKHSPKYGLLPHVVIEAYDEPNELRRAIETLEGSLVLGQALAEAVAQSGLPDDGFWCAKIVRGRPTITEQLLARVRKYIDGLGS